MVDVTPSLLQADGELVGSELVLPPADSAVFECPDSGHLEPSRSLLLRIGGHQWVQMYLGSKLSVKV
jgi:hypothetical protein